MEDAKSCEITIYSFQEVVDAGRKLETVEFNEPTTDSVFMLCYTSGTTGDPKAVELTHKNILSAAAAAFRDQPGIDENSSYISYLPLAHSLEQALFCVGVYTGSKYGFYSGDPLKLIDDLQVLKPTIFISVPRLYNRIYDKIKAGVKEKSPTQ